MVFDSIFLVIYIQNVFECMIDLLIYYILLNKKNMQSKCWKIRKFDSREIESNKKFD